MIHSFIQMEMQSLHCCEFIYGVLRCSYVDIFLLQIVWNLTPSGWVIFKVLKKEEMMNQGKYLDVLGNRLQMTSLVVYFVTKNPLKLVTSYCTLLLDNFPCLSGKTISWNRKWKTILFWHKYFLLRFSNN